MQFVSSLERCRIVSCRFIKKKKYSTRRDLEASPRSNPLTILLLEQFLCYVNFDKRGL